MAMMAVAIGKCKLAAGRKSGVRCARGGFNRGESNDSTLTGLWFITRELPRVDCVAINPGLKDLTPTGL